MFEGVNSTGVKWECNSQAELFTQAWSFFAGLVKEGIKFLWRHFRNGNPARGATVTPTTNEDGESDFDEEFQQHQHQRVSYQILAPSPIALDRCGSNFS